MTKRQANMLCCNPGCVSLLCKIGQGLYHLLVWFDKLMCLGSLTWSGKYMFLNS